MKTSAKTTKKRPFSPASNPEEGTDRSLNADQQEKHHQNLHDAALIDELIRYKAEKIKKEQNLQSLFKAIGLCLSLVMVLVAFESKFYESSDNNDLSHKDMMIDNMMDIPVTEQPPPPQPVIQQPQIVEVANEEEIVEEIIFTLDIQVTEETKVSAPVISDMGIQPEEEKPDEIFTIVENQPEPYGGYKTFYDFISNNLKYPQRAISSGIEGKVYVQFVVEKDGSLTDIQVLRGIGFGCDEEAVRVLSDAPKWISGKQRGKPVRVKMILPIHFKFIQR
jgi:periplasmic protein TonB